VTSAQRAARPPESEDARDALRCAREELIASVILAAGASSRMGTPKALLDYRGETFLDRLIRVLGTVTNPVIVVLGYHAAEILQNTTRAGVRSAAQSNPQFAINPEPERGQLSSLKTGLAALPAEAEGVAFIPMDCPAVREDTVARLAQAFLVRDRETLLVIPRHRDDRGEHRGHPVFAARPIAEEILALPSGAQARDVIHRHIPRTQYLDVYDPGILTDVDDPAAYRHLLESLP
jgi:molybdenum cofactor cytidylyltransferase